MISNEAPEALPEPMIDPFTEEVAVETDDSVIDFPTVAATAAPDEFLAMEEAEALDEAEDDSDDGMADLVAALPFLGLLVLFI